MKTKNDKKIFGNISLLNIVAMAAVVVLLILGGTLASNLKTKKITTTTPTVSGTQVISYQGEEGKTALEILKTKADVKAQESSFGIFVTSINGVENSDTNFWMFYVNGQLASSAADQYKTKADDKIEWRYEEFK